MEPPPQIVTMLLNAKYPRSTFVIVPHDDFGDRNATLEPRKIRRVGSDPSAVEDPFPGMMLQDIADAYLYLGPIAPMHIVEFPTEKDTPHARELERRRLLLAGDPRHCVFLDRRSRSGRECMYTDPCTLSVSEAP